jgi:DNA-binding beta-propeller fold protein YncE
MAKHTAAFRFLIIALLLVSPSLAPAQVIDFETVPGGSPTVDQQTISTEYSSLGVTFSLLDRTTGLPIGYPRIAKTGLPQTAFEGCTAADTPYPYLGLGQSFLTDGTAVELEGDLRIEYTTPVAQASGVILDVDCRTNGGPPCEQWTITAYDTMDAVIDTRVLDAPQGAINPGCVSPEAGPGDSNAFGWSFSFGSPQIKSIVLRYTGTAPNVGLGFDNFSLSSVPVALDVVAAAEVDSVCTGETVTLSASPSGGLPPYSFQWQEETAPAIWTDLGTGATQDVSPLATTNYRVVVTDSNDDDATSNLVTVAVDPDAFLCSASLIVACNSNSSVVRYSFKSQLPEVFVPSGTGTLNGTSKLVFGPDGNLYVSSQNNDRILRYDGTTGSFIDIFVAAGSGGLDVPVGLDFGPDGNLYVASNLSAVRRYDGSTGAYIDAFVPSGLGNPTGLLFGPDDDLYVCNRNGDSVLRYDGATGALIGAFVTTGSGGLDSPRGLIWGPDGNLYVCEEFNDSVRRYDGVTGAFIDVFIAGGSGGLDRANDIIFGPDGIAYVASFNNDQVLGYDATTGAFIGALPDGGILHGPAWLALGGPRVATAVGYSDALPLGITLEQNVPNPFNPTTTVRFTLPTTGRVHVTVVDVTGRIIATLLDHTMTAGVHAVEWTAGEAPSGVYFVRVESRGENASRKMVLLK